MFDLRYHVASLSAVFLALLLGIVVGAAISDPGLADRTSKQRLRDEIARLNERLDDAELRARQGEVAQRYAEASYDAVMHGRLAGRRVLAVSVGPADARLDAVTAAVRDAGGILVRVRVLDVERLEDGERVQQALAARPSLSGYVGEDRLGDVGRDLARELVEGGETTPLLDALSDVLVRQRSGGADDGPSADAAVVVRSAAPQGGPLARLVDGLYGGLRVSVAVGADVTSARASAVDTFARAGLSTVDSIDLVTGKVALAVLLAGGRPGSYGLFEPELLPPVEPVEPVERD